MKNNYIKRKLIKREEYYKFREYAPFFEEAIFDLHTLITAKKKRIVLLSDAGYGKSTELKTITYKLIEEESQDFIPIFVELDTYVDGEMIDYIKTKIGDESQSLLEYDKSKLIFLFDEFDQVFNKGKAARRIRIFMEKFNESNFIIACRTNFYSGQFDENFKIFVLLPFSLTDIKEYSRALLSNKSNVFVNQLEQYNYLNLAKNPFFLNHLIEIFNKDKNIPVTPSKIFPRIVSLALENDKNRLTSRYDLGQTYPSSEIEKDLMYLSLIMETLQRNFIAIDEFNEIFSDQNKRQVIPELSLIKKSFLKEGDVYQYQHNNFQEYLAAKMLSNQNLNIILEFISFRSVIKRRVSWIEKLMVTLEYVDFKPFGIKIDRLMSKLFSLVRYKRIDKINPSWANTVAFLCQLREKDDLLEYLIKNEHELTLKFEINRIDEAKRKEIFKKIFEKYTKRGIWINRNIDYDEMAKFGKSQEIYSYLMNYARAGDSFVSRFNAILMLGKMRGFEDESLRHLLIGYAKDENENQNVRYICFYTLTWLNMTSMDSINSLKHLKDSDNDRILSGLYYLIKESPHTEEFVVILLEGIYKTMYSPNSKKTPSYDVSRTINEALEKISSFRGLREIIRFYADNPECLREFLVERSMGKIIKNIIEIYDTDNSIYNDMKELAKITCKEHIDKINSKVQLFFEKTGTVFTLFNDLYKEGIEKNFRLMASIANEQCVNFLIDHYLGNNIDDRNMRGFISFLSSRNREKYDNLLSIINMKTNNNFLPPPHRDYEKEKKERIKREVEITFYKEEFMKEVKNIYEGENIEFLSHKDVEEIRVYRNNNNKYNQLVLKELDNYLIDKKDSKLKLDDFIKILEKCNYEDFTITHIFNLLYYGSELELSKDRIAVIRDFCLKNLKKVNFKDDLEQKDEGVGSSSLARTLWYFLRKYDFEYPEEVLLDMLSFDWLEGAQFVGIDYLESRLSPEKIRERILDNLNKGIKVGEVLKNHINYCKKYQLSEVRNQLFNIIKNPEIKMENRLLALKTVAGFPGSTTFLEEMLDINELELFIKSAEILIASRNNKSKEKLLLKLSYGDEKFALESAKLLIKEQDLSAIQYYCSYIKRTKKLKMDFSERRNPLQDIKTIKALPALIELLKFSYRYKKEIQQSELDSLDNTIINILKNIALQDFSNKDKVVKELQKFIQKYRAQFKSIDFLNAVCDDIEKAFLINYSSKIKVKEAIEKIKKNI